MRSAQDQLARAQAKLARLQAVRSPTFPAQWAANVEQAQADVAYWQAQADIEARSGLALLTGSAQPVTPTAQPARVITLYSPPAPATQETSGTNVVMAVGAVVGIVALVAWLRGR